MSLLLQCLVSIVLPILTSTVAGDQLVSNTCRSYCGNITIDYPFTVRSGCGHSGFRNLLFCINDVLMFHISSGSYRVLDIDYAYQALTLHDPDLSTCETIVRGKGNGFVIESWRAPYLEPASDNVFMLIGCQAESPLFQGFPRKHLPCRNVSGMGCEAYYECPAWDPGPIMSRHVTYSTGAPECCSVSFDAIRAINLSRLGCEAYSSAYNLAPLHVAGPSGWSYGIRVAYSVPGDYAFCRDCEATGGTCGYDDVRGGDLCLCVGWNSTTNCDKASSLAMINRRTSTLVEAFAGSLSFMAIYLTA